MKGQGKYRIFLNKMKVLLLITAILAVTSGFPVTQDPEREQPSVTQSNESPSQFYGPPFPYPLGPYYVPFLYRGYPWYPYNFPIPIPLSDPTTTPSSGQ
ncbi:follicular dendritic cell secreted peptide [Herpailurus yagouaroundi]|nr:follicular dendritic cell secreted peptide [Puma yagouaroundi]